MVKNDTGTLLRLKQMIGRKAYRAMSRPAAVVLSSLPPAMNYSLGLKARRSKYPYSLIEPTDTVVQIGAPRDLLKIGRSRSVYFALMARQGHTVIIEPDPDNVEAMRAHLRKMGLDKRATVVPLGAWSHEDKLEFLSSPDHPASNALGGVVRGSEQEISERKYNRIVVPVDSVDRIIERLGVAAPSLISITTNGAERQIIDGMRATIGNGCRYVALAATEPGLVDFMKERGFELVAFDDRGYTFRVPKIARAS